jgi:hypothetical protein
MTDSDSDSVSWIEEEAESRAATKSEDDSEDDEEIESNGESSRENQLSVNSRAIHPLDSLAYHVNRINLATQEGDAASSAQLHPATSGKSAPMDEFMFTLEKQDPGGVRDEHLQAYLGHDFLDSSNQWKYTMDNEFAEGIFKRVRAKEREGVVDSQLCGSCREMPFSAWRFDRVVDVNTLKGTGASCTLCRMLSRALVPSQKQHVMITKKGSRLMIGDRPILRVCIGLASPTTKSRYQIGFPVLPKVGGSVHFGLMRTWLRDCDTTHTQYNCSGNLNSELPTRVLDVGDGTNPHFLRLHCTKPGERGSYVTLSHRWGDPKVHGQFCTYRCNVHTLSAAIAFDSLPKTFQDAVTVARGIGVRHLWIDSLCIIQPHAGCSNECSNLDDWMAEAPKMGKYYGSSYCTIAATSAEGSTDGFLNPRPESEYVTFPTKSGSLFLCEVVDDFDHDVDEAGLNQRGWVLQERVLSTRTIHFTATQTYWECGMGVRCETLTRMENTKASLLGDPKFPSYFADRPHTNLIRLFQFLMEQYSKLDLTVTADRPVAISAITQRLAATFGGRERYGVFWKYPGRSLLWRRYGDKKSEQISMPAGQEKVPSWSWMANTGEIQYLKVPFESIEWNDVPLAMINGSMVPARRYLTNGIGRRNFMFDRDISQAYADNVRFVVIGGQNRENIHKGKRPGPFSQAPYCVIIILPVSFEFHHDTYQRIGIGWMDGGLLCQGREMVRIV